MEIIEIELPEDAMDFFTVAELGQIDWDEEIVMDPVILPSKKNIPSYVEIMPFVEKTRRFAFESAQKKIKRMSATK